MDYANFKHQLGILLDLPHKPSNAPRMIIQIYWYRFSPKTTAKSTI